MQLEALGAVLAPRALDAPAVEARRAPGQAVHDVALLQQDFGEVGTILAGDAGDERALRHKLDLSDASVGGSAARAVCQVRSSGASVRKPSAFAQRAAPARRNAAGVSLRSGRQGSSGAAIVPSSTQALSFIATNGCSAMMSLPTPSCRTTCTRPIPYPIGRPQQLPFGALQAIVPKLYVHLL